MAKTHYWTPADPTRARCGASVSPSALSKSLTGVSCIKCREAFAKALRDLPNVETNDRPAAVEIVQHTHTVAREGRDGRTREATITEWDVVRGTDYLGSYATKREALAAVAALEVKPTQPRYYVHTIPKSPVGRKVIDRYWVVDRTTNLPVDEYSTKRPATMHAEFLNAGGVDPVTS